MWNSIGNLGFYSCSSNTSSVWNTRWLVPCGLPELGALFHCDIILGMKAVSTLRPRTVCLVGSLILVGCVKKLSEISPLCFSCSLRASL